MQQEELEQFQSQCAKRHTCRLYAKLQQYVPMHVEHAIWDGVWHDPQLKFDVRYPVCVQMERRVRVKNEELEQFFTNFKIN